MADDLEGRRASLEKRLAERRDRDAEIDARSNRGDRAGMALAVKLSSEFIAGVLAGAGLGWVIDQLAGSSPWGLIVFLLLGFLAGVLNVMRATGAVGPARIKGDDGA
jgi:ATP synthase protein I